jgi:four helix bundle protein
VNDREKNTVDRERNEARQNAGYQDLIAWQRAIEMVDLVYKFTSKWPQSEMYGLTAQIRRAAVSVPANIAEGQGRNGRKEFLHYLSIAHGSLCEVETMIIIANRQGFLDDQCRSEFLSCSREVGRLINGLYRSLSRAT